VLPANRLFEFEELECAGLDRRVSLGPCGPGGDQREEQYHKWDGSAAQADRGCAILAPEPAWGAARRE